MTVTLYKLERIMNGRLQQGPYVSEGTDPPPAGWTIVGAQTITITITKSVTTETLGRLGASFRTFLYPTRLSRRNDPRPIVLKRSNVCGYRKWEQSL